jgi:hypothetical protein
MSRSKLYILLLLLLNATLSWSQDQGKVIDVEQEGDDWGTEYTDTIGGWGGWGDDGFIPID